MLARRRSMSERYILRRIKGTENAFAVGSIGVDGSWNFERNVHGERELDSFLEEAGISCVAISNFSV